MLHMHTVICDSYLEIVTNSLATNAPHTHTHTHSDDPLPSLCESSDMSPCRQVSVTSEMLQATLPMASMVAAVNALSELLMYVCEGGAKLEIIFEKARLSLSLFLSVSSFLPLSLYLTISLPCLHLSPSYLKNILSLTNSVGINLMYNNRVPM